MTEDQLPNNQEEEELKEEELRSQVLNQVHIGIYR